MPERSSAIEPYLRIGGTDARAATRKMRIRSIDFPGELFTWETLGAVVALALLTNLRLMGELSPFGFAFWVVAGRGEYRRTVLYSIVMLAAAMVTGGTLYMSGLALAAVIFWTITLGVQRVRIPLTILTGIALFAGALPRLWLHGFNTYDIMLLTMEVLLAMLAAAVFLQVYRHPPATLYPDRHIEGLTSWIVFAGLLLLSLVQGDTALSLLAGGIARVIVLWASFWFGPGLAAATGALLGFLLGVQGSGFIWLGVLTFAGFLAGLFKPYGKLPTAMGFLLGSGILSLYIAGWESVPTELTVTASAIVFFLLGPVVPIRLQALAPFLQRGPQDESERMRDLTAVRIKDYALVFRELSEAFGQAAGRELENAPPMTTFVEAVVERVCKYCPSRRRCWEKDLQRTYNALLRVLAELEGGQNYREMKSPDFFQKICRKRDEFLRTVSFLHELETYQHQCRLRVEESRDLVTMQLEGLSNTMFELAKEVREGVSEQHKRIKNQYFHVEIGVAQAAKGSADVCGDYYSYLELRDGKQAFIVSDGMGNGSKAHGESRSTVHLVEQLLLAGFRNEAVIRTVNTILQLRSSEESFATLDVLLVDTEKGEAEFLKIGAAPSYLRLRDRVREIKSPSVPLGILNEVEMKPVVVQMDDDALIVMVTDGIYEALPAQPDWLKKYLAGQTLSHPQVLADEIIHHARVLSDSTELRDDLTVLVCRAKRLKHKIRDFVTR
ncbi:MAG: SpoIIE family protein phosphatase [Bacillota bacterium]|nr:SpoIIE family protein phosphatase [Bacillota bacterium]MDW7683069.1 SpoIIE family protein phosphatase [Bacillota bacterium]